MAWGMKQRRPGGAKSQRGAGNPGTLPAFNGKIMGKSWENYGEIQELQRVIVIAAKSSNYCLWIFGHATFEQGKHPLHLLSVIHGGGKVWFTVPFRMEVLLTLAASSVKINDIFIICHNQFKLTKEKVTFQTPHVNVMSTLFFFPPETIPSPPGSRKPGKAMAKAGDACTAAKETLPMLSLRVKPKVFCAVLPPGMTIYGQMWITYVDNLWPHL